MHFSVLALTADASLGKIDYASLSQQNLMELLIENMDDAAKEEFQDDNGEFFDCCEWDGVECENDEVIEIDWSGRFEENFALQFQFLPPTVENFEGDASSLKGTLECGALPKSMKSLSLSECCNEGTLDLPRLPPAFKSLEVDMNALGGSLDLKGLPDSVEYLGLSNNLFEGSVDLTELPASLTELNILGNRLSGALNFQSLPASFVALVASNNQFTGTADLLAVPNTMRSIQLDSNKLSGVAKVKLFGDLTIDLRDNDIEKCIDAAGSPVVDKRVRM